MNRRAGLKLFIGLVLITLVSLGGLVVAGDNISNTEQKIRDTPSLGGGFGSSLTFDRADDIDYDRIDNPVNFEKDAKEINLSEMEIVNRSKSLNTYSDGNGTFVSVIYAAAINMKNLNGEYQPYEEVTNFNADENEMVLEWNDKSVKLKFYTKDKDDKKEKFSEKDGSKKNELKFKTNIKKQRGSYYFDHTLDKDKQPKKLGYDIETENVVCIIEGYSLICDEQKINFEQAVVEQNLTVEIGENFVEIGGDDLSYIDPSITQYASRTDTYCDDMGSTPEYDHLDDVLDDIGSDEITGGVEECNGLIQFYVDGFSAQLEQTWQIDSVYFGIGTKNIISEEGNGASTDFCIIDDLEYYDWTPDDQTEAEEIFDRLEDCSSDDFLFDYDFEEEEDYTWFSWRIDTLDTEVASEIIDNKDGSPDDALSIGMEGEYDSNDDERVDFYDEDDGTSAPRLVVNWHLPSPTIHNSAYVSGSPYTSNTWTKHTVEHCFQCNGDCSYTQYCTGSGCTPSGNYGSTEYCVDVSGQGTTYFRSRGVYSGTSTYYGSTLQYVDKVDKSAPSTSATATSNGTSYTFGETSERMSVLASLSCSDAYSGCSQTKYCIDVLDSCTPTTVYSGSLNISDFGTSYLRYYSEDNVGNIEGVQSKTIIIDDMIPDVNLTINGSNSNFTEAINNFLTGCVADSEGYCDVPIEFSASRAGVANISSISLYFNSTEYSWNVSRLGDGIYKTRIRAYDDVFYSNWSEGGEFNIGGIVYPNDTNKFIIQNSTSHTVAWLGDSGNLLLKGTCATSANCVAPANSFIMANSTDNTTAYISPAGDMCVESGDCSDLSATCNPATDAFIIQNSSSANMSYIDFDGNLCLTGRLYENVQF